MAQAGRQLTGALPNSDHVPSAIWPTLPPPESMNSRLLSHYVHHGRPDFCLACRGKSWPVANIWSHLPHHQLFSLSVRWVHAAHHRRLRVPVTCSTIRSRSSSQLPFGVRSALHVPAITATSLDVDFADGNQVMGLVPGRRVRSSRPII